MTEHTPFLTIFPGCAVVLYPEDKYFHEDIALCVKENKLDAEDLSALVQEVVVG